MKISKQPFLTSVTISKIKMNKSVNFIFFNKLDD